MIYKELQETINILAARGKGILAADESNGTIKNRFDAHHIECTEEHRRAYRELMFVADHVEDYISGVILFEETLGQETKAGHKFPEVLRKKGIATGIKVDKGTKLLPFYPNEKITEGLDGLTERLSTYKAMGAQFAKWRAVIVTSKINSLPSCNTIHANAEALARYAAICQSLGIVPIVEPEVLMDGDHDIDYCQMVTTNVLNIVFEKLHHHRVSLEHIILKPNMVIAGLNCPVQAGVEEVAEKTLIVLKRTVPAAVPSINFLSGGQSNELATQHLSAMNSTTSLPWNLSFSYGRALQAPVLKAWAGHSANVAAAQQALLKRAKLNGLASLGEYQVALEV